jgi:hypothetical protein
MSYSKTTWTEGITPLSPNNMNKIEQGIFDAHDKLADLAYPTAGGTANAITLTLPILANGYAKTFIASADNNGAATTINTKSLYKPNTTDAPTLVAGKAYTVWYNLASDCFFLKASATGTATPAQVLADVPFSNEEETDLVGTMPNRGAVIITPNGSQQTIPAGYHSGNGYVQAMPITADIMNKMIASGNTLTVGDAIYFDNAGNAVKSIRRWKERDRYYLANPGKVQYTYSSFRILKTNTSGSVDTFLIVFRYSTYLKMQAVQVNNDTGAMAYGSAVTLNESLDAGDFRSMVLLEANKVFIVYSVSGTDEYCRAKVLTISGTTITQGATYSDIDSIYADNRDPYVALISSTQVLVTWRSGAGAYGRVFAVVLNISGTTISMPGSVYTIMDTANRMQPMLCRLSATKFVLTAVEYDASALLYACVLTISDSVIAAGTIVAWGSAFTMTHYDYAMAMISSTKVLLIPPKNNGLSAYIMTISGTSVSIGSTAYSFGSDICSVALSEMFGPANKFYLYYRNDANGYLREITYSSGSDTLVLGAIYDAMDSRIFTQPNYSPYSHTGQVQVLSAKTVGERTIYNAIVIQYETNVVHKEGTEESWYQAVAYSLTYCKQSEGIALESGTEGQTISCYDWRYL